MKVIPAPPGGLHRHYKARQNLANIQNSLGGALKRRDFPPGVVSVLAAGSEVTQHLVEHAGVDMIGLTVQPPSPSDVVRRSAGRLARTALELGGKSPAIVAGRHSLADVLATLVDGAAAFLGQVCVSLSRIRGSPSAANDEFVSAMADGTASSIRLPWEPGTTEVPGGRAARTRSENASLAAVRDGPNGRGWTQTAPSDARLFYEPTLLRGVSNAMTVAQEEIFGPVTAVIPYAIWTTRGRIETRQQVWTRGSVYTGDLELAMSVARRLRSAVSQSICRHFPTEPFGGVKQSGLGPRVRFRGILESPT